MRILANPPWLTIITGHYGVGKTNLALNLVRDLRSALPRVTLIDLDIVNPYFRSTDHIEFLKANDVEVFGPVYARSTLDTPSLAPGIDEAITEADASSAVLVDVGGDPDGARALGRYSAKVAARDHRLLFVVNLHRPDMGTVAENLQLLQEIETTSGLKATGIIGNSHLKEFSSAADIAKAAVVTLDIAKATGVPLVAITAPRALAHEVEQLLGRDAQLQTVAVYPVDRIVVTPWE